MANPTTAKWTDPTTNTDGTPIAAGEISGYEIGVRDTSAVGSVAGTYAFGATAPATGTSELLSLLTPVLPTGKPLAGAVRAVTAAGNSAWSAEANFTLQAPPSPPTNFIVS